METLVSGTLLESVWKRHIRSALRVTKFTDFYLAADAVQYAAYEWGLAPFIARLRDELRDGSYSPESADIMRGAKRSGLSRPLAFLAPRDALVYHTIVVRALPDLVKELRPWTGALQKDKMVERMTDAEPTLEAAGEAEVAGHELRTTAGNDKQLDTSRTKDMDYGNFFGKWLAKQGAVYNILKNRPYVVESDVANYYCSVDLRVVQEFLSRSGLDRDVVRLVIYLLKNVLRHPQYADSPGMGLPQEPINSSRHIAHGLLVEVDRSFDQLGGAGLYARFMDDFVAGAATLHEGHEIVAILQGKLETLGLYPNPAKTRVFHRDDYRRMVLVDENEYLDNVDSCLIETKVGGVRARTFPKNFDAAEFFDRARAFRSLQDRPARWERVLRRYYRYLRELGSNIWLEHVLGDLQEFPEGASHFLEYVRSFPLQTESLVPLFDSMLSARSLYGNVPLLILETLSTAPTSGRPEVVRLLLRLLDEVSAALTAEPIVPRSRQDWILAYCVPLESKFGTAETQMAWIESLGLSTRPPQAVVRLHAAPLQVACGSPSRSLFISELAGLSWSSVLALDFLRALEDGDDRARGVVLGLSNAEVRLLPNRHQVHPRALSLLRILARQPTKRGRDALDRAIQRLASNEVRLRDEVMISALKEVRRPYV
jgi:hypothetical protein